MSTLPNYKRTRLLLTFLFIICELGCLIGLYQIKNYDYLRMAIGDMVFWLGFTIIEKRKNWYLPNYIRAVVIIAILSDTLLGDLMYLYVSSPLYDRIQHIFGTYALTLWVFFIIQKVNQKEVLSKQLQFFFLIGIGAALGTIYELIEFTQDLVFNPVIKNQPSLRDTDFDLISDLIGSLVVAFHVLINNRTK